MKADEKMEESNVTNFEYVNELVDLLLEEIQKMQTVLKANDLHIPKKEYADTQLDSEVWRRLEEKHGKDTADEN